ncbi:hypothetical protein DICSQDRAFT_14970, partial [Dichomitus squalens LYAD-421 SS1]
AVFLASMLVSWLHLSGHLPFRYCDTVLTVIGYILMAVGQKDLLRTLLGSLGGAFSTLRLEPSFQILPVCPECHDVFPTSVPFADPLTRCRACRHPLFRPVLEAEQGRRGRRQKAKPLLAFPFKSLVEQLATILGMPGVEDAMDAWRKRPRVLGLLADIFDGRICRKLLGPDGLSFFRYDLGETGPNDELRIGLTLGVDWFSYLRSKISPSHSSCPMSFSIINLPFYLRYRTAYLLLAGIMPGPKEADPDQVQRYMRVLVNELIRLWKYGAMVPTPKYPKGRRIRVILVGVVCDKPAAHKLGGFGSHAHTYFCIQDWISQTFKATIEAFKANAFRTRTDAEHRSFMAQYQQCSSKGEREDFARKYATRWSELARLPYFDMCRMIVVDPMHNLFLGLVKTHFYHIWVQLKILRKTKELRQLHSVLEKLELPATLGRLPRLIGEPAGGSLTADQWLILATVIGPLVIPDIWRDCAPDPDGSRLQQRLSALTGVAAKRRAQRTTRYAAPGGKAGSKRKRTSGRVKKRAPKVSSASRTDISDDDGGIEIDAEENWSDDSSDGDDAWSAQASIHERDVPNFLKLAEALTTFLADELSEDDVMIADQRLREYCTELLELYGPAIIRPNHHYATHTGDFVLDYGPLREFWTFVFERLNKVLKSFKTTGRAGGELECSFFREFHRSVRLHRLVSSAFHTNSDPGLQASCDAMLAAAADDRGTLQNLVQDLDNTFADKGKICELSRRASREMFPEDLYYTLLKHVQSRHPLQQFHSFISLAPSPTSTLVPNIATFFDYAIIHGHRYYASRRTISPRNSLALVQWNTSGSPSQRRHAGEITDIFMFEHPSVGAVYLAAVRW